MSNKLWQRQPGESSFWYGRFEIYRLLGSKRTLEGAFKLAAATEGLQAERPGAAWLRAAKRWQWQERAEAWDEQERQHFLRQEEIRRIDARRRRLQIIETVQEQAFAALRVASLGELKATATEDVATAREILATLRMLLFDALKAERLEYGESTEIVAGGVAPYSADEMASAMAEVEAWRKRRMNEPNG